MEHRWDREWMRNGHRVIECESCGYRHLYPLPNESELKTFYREHYHKEKKHIPYNKVDKAFVAKRVEDMRVNLEFGHIYGKVAAFLSKKAPLTMIDIGGGNNLLSRFFTDRGWDCTVFEPNVDAANYLRRFGLKVIECMFEHSNLTLFDTYSFLNLQFVLEHALDPIGMLGRIAELMSPDSLLRVCVSNDFSPGQLAWLNKSGLETPWISYPDHINYFDFSSLCRLLQCAGFTEITRDTTFPLEFLLLTGNDYYTDESVKQNIGAIVVGFENAMLDSGQEDCLAAFYEKLADLGMGRSAIIYARKNNDK